MLLSTSVVLEELKEIFDIVMFDLPCHTSVCSYRFYGSEAPDSSSADTGLSAEASSSAGLPGILYLATPEQLAFVGNVPDNAAFICCGVAEPIENTFGRDLILTRNVSDLLPLANALGAIFDKYNAWESRLIRTEVSAAGMNAMVGASRDILHGSIIVADYHFNYIAYTDDFARNIGQIRRTYRGQTPPYIVEELLTNPEYFKVQNLPELFEYPIHDGHGTVPALCCNLFREGEAEYRARILFVSDYGHFTDAQRFLLRVLGDHMSVVYNQLSDYSLPLSAFNGLREMILRSLKEVPSASALIAPGLRAVGWDPSDEYRVLVFQSDFLENTKEMNSVSRTQLELILPFSCGVITENRIVLVINYTGHRKAVGDPEPNIRKKLSDYLREHLYKAGASLTLKGFEHLREGYFEAIAALRIGNRRDNMFWYYSFEDYMMD